MLAINDNKKSIFVELLRLFRILPLFLHNTRFSGWEKLAHLRPLLSESHSESSDTQVKREPPPQTCFHKYREYISKYQVYSKRQDKHPRRQKNTLNSFFFFHCYHTSPFLNPPKSSLHIIFIKCSRPHFSFTIKVSDTFVRRWGISAKKVLKWWWGEQSKKSKQKCLTQSWSLACLKGENYKAAVSSLSWLIIICNANF